MMVSLAGCGSRKHKSYTTLRVGVITYTQNDAFINALTDCLKTELKSMETAHMKIIVSIRSADDDQEDQDEVAAEMIDAGCDILCVNLVDRTAPSKIIRNARDNDIPVIFLTGNLLWMILCSGISCIMWDVMRNNQERCRERLPQII